MGISIFDLFLMGVGVYALISGIRGKGRLFTVENIKEGCEEKIMKGQRILYGIMGVTMMLNGLSSLLVSFLFGSSTVGEDMAFTPPVELNGFSFLTAEFLNMAMFIFMLISLGSVIYLVVFLRKMTNRPAKGRSGAAADAAKTEQHILPTAAFDFEEEEEKDSDQ